MNQSSSEPLRRRWGFAIFLMVVAGAALSLSFVRERGGFATQHDPGPWVLPRLLAVSLLVGGIILLVIESRSQPGKVGSETNEETAPSSSRKSAWKLPALVGGLIVYVAALPWAGFVTSTTVFATLLLLALRIVWWRAVLAAGLLVAVGHGLFAILFKVPLPGGMWN